jgi:hypothetical protein
MRRGQERRRSGVSRVFVRWEVADHPPLILSAITEVFNESRWRFRRHLLRKIRDCINLGERGCQTRLDPFSVSIVKRQGD